MSHNDIIFGVIDISIKLYDIINGEFSVEEDDARGR